MITQAIVTANHAAPASSAASSAAGSDQGASFQALFASELNAAQAGIQSIKPAVLGGLDAIDAKQSGKKSKAEPQLLDAGGAQPGVPQLVQLPITPLHVKHDVAANDAGAKPETAQGQASDVLAAAPRDRAPLPVALKQEPAKTDAVKTESTFSKTLAKDGQPVTTAAATAAKPAEIAAGGNSLPTRHATAEQLLPQAEPKKSAGSDLPSQLITAPAPLALQPLTHKAATDAPAKLSVDTPVGAPGWNADLGHKVVWMSNEKQHVAELQLNPPNLGPMEVRVTVNNDQTSVQFVSQNSEVRQAIEAAMPKLREMMADSGISLGNTSVGSGAFQQSAFTGQEQSQSQGQSRQQGSYSGSQFAPTNPIMVRTSRLEGRVDTFA